ncbi:MAG: hypothetical protein ACYDH9_11270 [Limisphaerales bacterium]
MNAESNQPLSPRILEVIYRTVDEANEQQDANRKIAKSIDTVLLGDSGVLDSVGLINFIILLEQHIEQSLGPRISLTTDSQLYGMDSPLRTVQLLAQYLERLLPPASL